MLRAGKFGLLAVAIGLLVACHSGGIVERRDTLTLLGKPYPLRVVSSAGLPDRWIITVSGSDVACLTPDETGCYHALNFYSQFYL